MKAVLRRLARDARGATAVEFGMVLLPFLLLMFGGFEFARLAWTRQALQETAISGSRCMGLLASGCATGAAYSASGTQAYIAARAASFGVTVPTSGMTLNRSATCAGVANFSSVTLTYTFQTVVPQLIQPLTGGKTLTATACFPNNA